MKGNTSCLPSPAISDLIDSSCWLNGVLVTQTRNSPPPSSKCPGSLKGTQTALVGSKASFQCTKAELSWSPKSIQPVSELLSLSFPYVINIWHGLGRHVCQRKEMNQRTEYGLRLLPRSVLPWGRRGEFLWSPSKWMSLGWASFWNTWLTMVLRRKRNFSGVYQPLGNLILARRGGKEQLWGQDIKSNKNKNSHQVLLVGCLRWAWPWHSRTRAASKHLEGSARLPAAMGNRVWSLVGWGWMEGSWHSHNALPVQFTAWTLI